MRPKSRNYKKMSRDNKRCETMFALVIQRVNSKKNMDILIWWKGLSW